MTYVLRQNNESVEKMLGRFRRLVMKEGVINRMRARKYHVRKPSKRQQKIRAMYRTEKLAESSEQ